MNKPLTNEEKIKAIQYAIDNPNTEEVYYKLLDDIITYQTFIFNNDNRTYHEMEEFTANDLNKLAFWSATGSGKSTLLHMLGALDRPTSGKVLIDNNDISNMKEEQLAVFRRRKIGFIFQFYNLIQVLNVEENIALPISLDHGRVDKKYIEEIIKIAKENRVEKMIPDFGPFSRVELQSNPICEKSMNILDKSSDLFFIFWGHTQKFLFKFF